MKRPRRAAWRTGLGLAALYGVTVVATGLWTGHPVRPLFDGIGASTPYKWVRPPWYVGAANIKPERSHTDIPFENGASSLVGLTSQDGQVVLNLPAGAMPPAGGASAVRVSFEPIDPKKLAKPPAGTRPDGNAYRLGMTYLPSQQPLEQTAAPGNVIVVVPEEADKILYSPDGEAWEPMPTQVLGDPTTVGTIFSRGGYYTVSTSLPQFEDPDKGKRTKRIIGISMTVASLALLFGYVAPTVLRRSRAEQAAGKRGGAGRRRRTRTVRRRK
ncbi:MAG: hypothetical protein ACREI3_04635 [Nitrospirales bacterium]